MHIVNTKHINSREAKTQFFIVSLPNQLNTLTNWILLSNSEQQNKTF